ncbi:MAG: RNA-binding protein [Candidatus Anstonellales archaeon]
MSKKLYVGNLPFSVTQDQLKEMFSSYGSVSEAIVISDRMSGRSKGFGFVTFDEDAAADKAMAEMNGKDVEGRQIKVTEARPPSPGGRGGFGRGPGRGRDEF